MKSLWMVVFLTWLAHTGNAVDARFYYCHGEGIDLTFFQTFAPQSNCLELDIGGETMMDGQAQVIDSGESIKVEACTKQHIEITLPLEKPKKMANAHGPVALQPSFGTEVVVSKETEQYFHVECSVFDLEESFFDEIASGIP